MSNPGDPYYPKDADELEAFMRGLCEGCVEDDKEGCAIIRDFIAPACHSDERPEEWLYNKFGQITCTAYRDDKGTEGASIIEDRCPETFNLFSGEK